MALMLIRVMEILTAQVARTMSPVVLKEELSDLKEILMIYDTQTAEIQISRRSSIQQRLWDLFDLGSVEKQLTGH